MFSQFLTVVVLVVVGARLVQAARLSFTATGQSTVRSVLSRIGWRHVWPVPLVLAAVAAAATALLAVPGLDWGWWTALGGQGNPITGTTNQTNGTVWSWLIPLVFLVLLAPALPLFALAEERMFRRDSETWSWPKRVAKTAQFGMIHALIGIPIGVALALSIGGAYFMWRYLRWFARTGDRDSAVLESTAAHTCYNAMILAVVAVVVVLGAAGVV